MQTKKHYIRYNKAANEVEVYSGFSRPKGYGYIELPVDECCGEVLSDCFIEPAYAETEETIADVSEITEYDYTFSLTLNSLNYGNQVEFTNENPLTNEALIAAMKESYGALADFFITDDNKLAATIYKGCADEFTYGIFQNLTVYTP